MNTGLSETAGLGEGNEVRSWRFVANEGQWSSTGQLLLPAGFKGPAIPVTGITSVALPLLLTELSTVGLSVSQ